MKKEFCIIVIVALFLVLPLLVTAAFSQMISLPMPCGPTASLVRMLENKYNEQVIGFGPTRAGELVRLYVAEKTFTLLITRHDGTSCMVAGGTIWETMIRGQPT